MVRCVDHGGRCIVKKKIELLVRAQKLQVRPRSQQESTEGPNIFPGHIHKRMYMGGEAWYFIQMSNETIIHAIDISREKPFREGDAVTLHVPPNHCRLLPLKQREG